MFFFFWILENVYLFFRILCNILEDPPLMEDPCGDRWMFGTHRLTMAFFSLCVCLSVYVCLCTIACVHPCFCG